MKRLIHKLTVLLILPTLFSGCAYQTIQPNPAYAPVRPQVTMLPPKDDGGIFRSETSNPLFESDKARHIGDILTVVFDENHGGYSDGRV